MVNMFKPTVHHILNFPLQILAEKWDEATDTLTAMLGKYCRLFTSWQNTFKTLSLCLGKYSTTATRWAKEDGNIHNKYEDGVGEDELDNVDTGKAEQIQLPGRDEQSCIVSLCMVQ